jgi:hypothetical protein
MTRRKSDSWLTRGYALPVRDRTVSAVVTGVFRHPICRRCIWLSGMRAKRPQFAHEWHVLQHSHHRKPSPLSMAAVARWTSVNQRALVNVHSSSRRARNHFRSSGPEQADHVATQTACQGVLAIRKLAVYRCVALASLDRIADRQVLARMKKLSRLR